GDTEGALAQDRLELVAAQHGAGRQHAAQGVGLAAAFGSDRLGLGHHSLPSTRDTSPTFTVAPPCRARGLPARAGGPAPEVPFLEPRSSTCSTPRDSESRACRRDTVACGSTTSHLSTSRPMTTPSRRSTSLSRVRVKPYLRPLRSAPW